MDDKYTIKQMDVKSVLSSGALNLVWHVFLAYEAPEYTKQGVAEFKAYIEPKRIEKKMGEGALFFWGCFLEDTIVGVIAMRQPCHISLLFVDPAHHRKGIARALYETVISHYKKPGKSLIVTVNASPYAEAIYERLGFIPTDTEQAVSGIRFIPMKHMIP